MYTPSLLQLQPHDAVQVQIVLVQPQVLKPRLNPDLDLSDCPLLQPHHLAVQAQIVLGRTAPAPVLTHGAHYQCGRPPARGECTRFHGVAHWGG